VVDRSTGWVRGRVKGESAAAVLREPREEVEAFLPGSA
jgi:hypothetical protein